MVRRHKKSSLVLVKSAPAGMVTPEMFRTGDAITESGVYLVTHSQHRLPQEVTLLRGNHFPRCAQCQEAVTFTLLRAVAEGSDLARRIVLYELPVLNDEGEALAV